MTQLSKRTVYYTAALCVWPPVMLSRVRDYLFLLFSVINDICVSQHVDHHRRRLIILLLCGLVCDCRPTDRRRSSVPFFSSGECVQYAHVIIIYVGIYVYNNTSWSANAKLLSATGSCYRPALRPPSDYIIIIIIRPSCVCVYNDMRWNNNNNNNNSNNVGVTTRITIWPR